MSAARERLPAILVRLDPDVKATLQAEADGQMRSLTNLVAVILTSHAQKGKPKPAKMPRVNGNGAHRHTKAAAAP